MNQPNDLKNVKIEVGVVSVWKILSTKKSKVNKPLIIFAGF